MTTKTIGPYEIRGELGRGAMATVWRAWDSRIKREVAIKEPRFEEGMAEDVKEDIAERFAKEGRAAAKLNHPGIVTIYEADVYDGRPVIVMEYIKGQTLHDVLIGGSLPPQTVLQILDQLLDAVGFAHQNDIVHRDIKPDNIFLTEDRRVQLTDFGIARTGDSKKKKTQVGTVLGTPGYMSPEQAKGLPVDSRTDIFAIGVIAYEMLTGANPFDIEGGGDATSILYRIVHEPVVELPDSVTAGLPDDIRPVIAAALSKDPDDRPHSAEAFKAMLHGQTVLPPPKPQPSPPSFGSDKKLLPYALVAGIGFALVIILMIAAGGGGNSGVVNSSPENMLTGSETAPYGTASGEQNEYEDEVAIPGDIRTYESAAFGIAFEYDAGLLEAFESPERNTYPDTIPILESRVGRGFRMDVHFGSLWHEAGLRGIFNEHIGWSEGTFEVDELWGERYLISGVFDGQVYHRWGSTVPGGEDGKYLSFTILYPEDEQDFWNLEADRIISTLRTVP